MSTASIAVKVLQRGINQYTATFSGALKLRSLRSLHVFEPQRSLRLMAAGGSSHSTLETLRFVNGAVKKLPLDTNKENYVRSVEGVCSIVTTNTIIIETLYVTRSLE